MEDWLLWLILAVIFGVGEIATLGFFLAPFAGGAAIAAVVSAIGVPFVGSLAVFLVVSVILLAALRPLARSHRRMPPSLRTGTAALVGKSATVVERIANDEGVGCVKIDGDVWTARAYMEEETYEPGTRVQVVEIRGATALVTD
ncbi:MAG TPA: NfeD family protein [Solirubrobacteraceae bacterium]|jgi:membrane protein implicated in regulation of membrane protease activity|nr:NfeD family protein [Solirubrobacteraceae bacterium]